MVSPPLVMVVPDVTATVRVHPSAVLRDTSEPLIAVMVISRRPTPRPRPSPRPPRPNGPRNPSRGPGALGPFGAAGAAVFGSPLGAGFAWCGAVDGAGSDDGA